MNDEINKVTEWIDVNISEEKFKIFVDRMRKEMQYSQQRVYKVEKEIKRKTRMKKIEKILNE